jgi:hypothetical protein
MFMESLVQHGMWPLAAVIIAIAGFGIFRAPIAALLNRTKKIGAGGSAIDFSETTERQQNNQVTAAKTETASNQITSLGPPSPAVAEMEAQVAERLNAFNDDDAGKISRLKRGLATLALQRDFEIIYRVIFGSQLDLLLKANARPLDNVSVQAIYDEAKSLFPSAHDKGSLEAWLSFPLTQQLLLREDGLIYATPRGKEFLQYLVEVGLTLPKSNG